ncbi:unnamed protein product, partial [Bubo scandiacus]
VFWHLKNHHGIWNYHLHHSIYRELWHIGIDWESSFEYLIIWMCCEHTENNMNFKCMP